MALLQNSIVAAAPASEGDDDVVRSLRFEDNAYLSFTPSSATSTRQKAVINFWFKLAEPEASSARYCVFFSAGDVQGSGTEWFGIHYDASTGKFHISNFMGVSAGVVTDSVYRDYGAFYNLHFIVDTTQSTSTDRFKLYINGEQQTLTGTFPTQNSNMHIGEDKPHRFGYQDNPGYHGTTSGPQVYIANAYLLENSTLPHTNFIEDNGYGGFKPKATSGLTFGTNGFHLKFEDSSDIGSDSSGNSNDFTATNLASHDVMLDTPTKNYATINVVHPTGAVTAPVSEGNLKIYANTYSGSNYEKIPATIPIPTSGKWYVEFYAYAAKGSGNIGSVGVIRQQDGTWGSSSGNHYGLTTGNGFDGIVPNIYGNNITLRSDGVAVDTDSGGTLNNSAYICALAIDVDNGKIYGGYESGGAMTWMNSGDPTSGSTGTGAVSRTFSSDDLLAIEVVVSSNNTNGSGFVMNYGQDPTFAGNKTSGQDTSQSEFYYAPPSSEFKSLNTSNLDDPTLKPHEYFNTLLYTGNGNVNRDITGVGFQPDFTWIKNRTSSRENVLHDSVRGAGKELISNSTAAESNKPDYFGPFASDGFRLANNASAVGGAYNDSNNNYVAWNWKESASAGFDIVTYEGDSDTSGDTQSISHSLGVAPDMIIIKARDGRAASDYYTRDNWFVWHKDLSSDSLLFLNSTNAEEDYSSAYGSAPISSVGSSTFTVSNTESSNSDYDFLNWGDPHGYYTGDNERYVAYLFSSVEGVSMAGSFTGNGSSDGPFVYTGFRPAFVMVKNIDSSGPNWGIQDNQREGYNPTKNMLFPDNSASEGTVQDIDLCSNGFKVRNTYNYINQSGSKIIFLAFAESPFKHANAR